MIRQEYRNEILHVTMSGRVDTAELIDSLRDRIVNYDRELFMIVSFEKDVRMMLSPRDLPEIVTRLKGLAHEHRPRWTVFYVMEERPGLSFYINFWIRTAHRFDSSAWITESTGEAERLVRGLKSVRVDRNLSAIGA